MDCTNTNFEEVYESIAKHLPSASFIAMDLEFTGISTNEESSIFDLPHERYNKLKTAATRFRIIQVGLSLFTDLKNDRFEARTYNVYVFPREKYNYSPIISLDASAIEFNMTHKMNFHKWIYEGVTYAQHYFAEKKRKELNNHAEEEKKEETAKEIVLTLDSDLLKKDILLKNIDEWAKTDQKEPLVIDESSAFFQKFILQHIAKNHPELLAVQEPRDQNSKDRVLKVYKFTPEQRKEYEEKKHKEKVDYMNSAIGFTRVIELLIKAKKPLVGHNCYFDLLFLYNSFLENLPKKYSDFKKKLNEKFPTIIDTKVIANNLVFSHLFQEGGSSLETVLLKIREAKEGMFSKKELVIPEGFEKYNLFNPSEGSYHEAGFDALLTGYVYMKMYYQLDPQTQKSSENIVYVPKSLHFVRLDKEADTLQHEKPRFVFSKNADDTKFLQSDLFDHFKDLKFETGEIRVSIFQRDKESLALVTLEAAEEEKMIAFNKRCQELKEKGELVEAYDSYIKRKIIEYEEAEKAREEKEKDGKSYQGKKYDNKGNGGYKSGKGGNGGNKPYKGGNGGNNYDKEGNSGKKYDKGVNGGNKSYGGNFKQAK